MALITQEPLKKIKEVDVTILINDELLKDINEYCRLAGITRGFERNGEAKTSTEARREYFIIKAIERVLEEDREALEALKGESDTSTYSEVLEEGTTNIKSILSDDMKDLVKSLIGEEVKDN